MERMKPKSVSAMALLMVVPFIGTGGCGYTTARPFRTDIQTIHVDMFHSKEFRRELEFRLTEALVKRLEMDTPYRIAPRRTADMLLTGEILAVENRAFAGSPCVGFLIPSIKPSSLITSFVICLLRMSASNSLMEMTGEGAKGFLSRATSAIASPSKTSQLTTLRESFVFGPPGRFDVGGCGDGEPLSSAIGQTPIPVRLSHARFQFSEGIIAVLPIEFHRLDNLFHQQELAGFFHFDVSDASKLLLKSGNELTVDGLPWVGHDELERCVCGLSLCGFS